MSEMILIDGSQGEGGGQILRTALALSLVTGRPFRIDQIRAGRRKPGLLRQHLTAVQAAVEFSGARVTGASLGSTSLLFEPSRVTGGDRRLAVGSAGSVTLVLQAILPALLVADRPTRLTLEGGTHNPGAPPFDFLAKAFLPLLRLMGARAVATLESHGFYPAGGGRFVVEVDPCQKLQPLNLVDRGETTIRVRCLLSSLPDTIARRELGTVRRRLGLDRMAGDLETIQSPGPGNVLMIEIASAQVTEVVTGFGMKGVTSEQVANAACDEVQAYLSSGAPVGPYLADQLLLPMALAGAGAFLTLAPTSHTTTNASVIGRFLDAPIVMAPEDGREGVYRVTVGKGN
jgi:RNA 3'-terminal phosphate cyclase (ATP)